jgi:hypothetical protein
MKRLVATPSVIRMRHSLIGPGTARPVAAIGRAVPGNDRFPNRSSPKFLDETQYRPTDGIDRVQ